MHEPTSTLWHRWVITLHIKQRMQLLIHAVFIPWVIWGRWQLFTSRRVLFLDHLSYPYIYIYIKEIIHTQLPAACSLESFSAGKRGQVQFITSHILNTDNKKHRTRIYRVLKFCSHFGIDMLSTGDPFHLRAKLLLKSFVFSWVIFGQTMPWIFNEGVRAPS